MKERCEFAGVAGEDPVKNTFFLARIGLARSGKRERKVQESLALQEGKCD